MSPTIQNNYISLASLNGRLTVDAVQRSYGSTFDKNDKRIPGRLDEFITEGIRLIENNTIADPKVKLHTCQCLANAHFARSLLRERRSEQEVALDFDRWFHFQSLAENEQTQNNNHMPESVSIRKWALASIITGGVGMFFLVLLSAMQSYITRAMQANQNMVDFSSVQGFEVDAFSPEHLQVREIDRLTLLSNSDNRTLVSYVKPAIVHINSDLGRTNHSGAGIICTPDGIILTNDHVMRCGITGGPLKETVKVTLLDGRVLRGKLLGSDPVSDLAAIKIDLDNLPTLNFAGVFPSPLLVSLSNICPLNQFPLASFALPSIGQ